MKTKIPFNIAPYIPHADEVQYTEQISDHLMFSANIENPTFKQTTID